MVKEEIFSFTSSDGQQVSVYKWIDDSVENPKGVVQIAHGMAEHAGRYKRFAKELTERGYIVYGNDHRGHGMSAVDRSILGYLGDSRGFELLVEDMNRLTDIVTEENPDLPIYLFSHSMGSFATQRYIMDMANKDKLSGVVLSGSGGRQGPILKLAKILAKLSMIFKGKKAKAKLMDRLIFGSYNKNFEPKTTGFEWLSRDEKEVKKYVEDPYCGTLFPTSFFYEFIKNLIYVEDENNYSKIPKDLPILIVSGDQDPVGDYGKGVTNLKDRYKKIGIKDLKMKLYPGARHELLNELNKEEVTTDIISWLEVR